MLSLLISLITTMNAQAMQCHNVIKHSYQDSKSIEVYKTETNFEVREKKRFLRQKFFFLSHIKDGTVYINASLKNAKRHSSELRGKVLFEHMMKHFKSQNINFILGHWFSYSDNYKTFVEAMESGVDPSTAALQTWTGRQASKHGYKFASVTLVKHSSRDPNFDAYMVFFSKDPEDNSNVIEEILMPLDLHSL